MSHIGARRASRVVRAIIRAAELQLVEILDTHGDALAAVGWHGFAHRLYHAAALAQIALGQRHNRPAAAFEFTLSVAVLGRLRVGWLAVGDSPLIVCRHGITGLIAKPEIVEFANQTSFVVSTPPPPPVCQSGLIPADGLQAVIAMSDGAASRLIHLTGVPAAAVHQILTKVAEGQWASKELRHELEDSAWDLVTGDDRSVALLVSSSPIPEAEAA